ncbi:MAG: tRNA (adenosine(37)-N6)-threonylcarbamoyltransferase complex dimerization subunit type 1 TsaB [candidate division Zixibacteria bacterium]|nr:tRNA (adenosine(37)-N6)-threonylcarbamoyltransferase complex dimerization subunit type 1 TsaB [candidate division Zixibacteria bacterium]
MTNPSYQHVLAIDTSTSVLRLALSFGSDRVVKLNEDIGASHGQMLVRKIQDLLDGAGIQTKQLGALVICTGPGSFTGLRIGLAAAKGIAEALDIPIVGVSLFDIVVLKLRNVAGEICVVVPFKRDECFVATIENGRFDSERIEAVPIGKIRAFVKGRPVTSVGIKLPPDLSSSGSAVPPGIEYDAADLLQVGMVRLEAGNQDDISQLQPLYVQKSQAELRYEQRRKDQ